MGFIWFIAVGSIISSVAGVCMARLFFLTSPVKTPAREIARPERRPRQAAADDVVFSSRGLFVVNGFRRD